MKLALGTVQFGLDYGISNKEGQTSLREVRKIIQQAQNAGIDALDTAFCYGDAEKNISKVSVEGFEIITKVLKPEEFELSLKNLGRNNVYALMFHNTDVLIENPDYWDDFKKFKAQKKVKKIGVSIYTKEQILKVIDAFDIDIIQLPINVLDQRLIKSGVLKKLKAKNIEIHVRSVFLQGLLLMDYDDINPKFAPLKPIIADYFKFLEENNLTKLQGALNFVKNIEGIDKIVIGVNTCNQLQEILEAYKCDKIVDYDRFSNVDSRLLNPSNWGNLNE